MVFIFLRNTFNDDVLLGDLKTIKLKYCQLIKNHIKVDAFLGIPAE